MRRLGHSCQVSEDLTQEIFLRAWQHIGQLRSANALNSWLYRIAGNVSRLHWRRHKIRELAGLEGIDVSDGSEPECDKAGQSELLGQIKTAVTKLPIKLRQAVVLHYMQHLSIAESAAAAEVREGTFKSRLNRALKVLERQIASGTGEK
jgi:RNA polymerase sigma-70 factor (ECF subfamily)